MRRGEAPVGFDQELKIRADRFPHAADEVNCGVLHGGINEAAPRARKRIKLGGGKAFLFQLQHPVGVFLDRGGVAPTISIDAHVGA
jgi:hypothetical protein